MPGTTKVKKELPVNFQLNGIELLEACLHHHKQVKDDFTSLNFEIKIEHTINKEKKLFTATISIDVFNDQNEFKLGSITSICRFEITNMSDFVDPKSKQIILPEKFIHTINSITISTARGIMFDQFKGTFLHHAFLPIVNPKSFVNQK